MSKGPLAWSLLSAVLASNPSFVNAAGSDPPPSTSSPSPVGTAATPAATPVSPSPNPSADAHPSTAASAQAPGAAGESDETITFRASDMETFAARSAREVGTSGGVRARYALNLFGDVGGGVSGGTGSDTKSTFGVGGIDLLFTGDLDRSIKMTAESAIEFNDANEPGIDLERMHLRWTSRGFWIEAGRSHTDLGYWNLAYHHGKWLQPTIERPLAVRFEDDGGILPIHWVGVQVGYRAELGGDVALTVSAAVGNGRGAIVDDVQSAVDTHAGKQGYGKLEIKGLFTRDLRIGVSALYGYISPQSAMVRPALPDAGINEEIGNVYIAHASYPVTFVAEGFAIDHRGAGSTWRTYDAFAVLGYTFGVVTPYLSGERRRATNGGTDPFFIPDPASPSADLDLAEGIVGARVDASTWSAVKVEYRAARFFDRSVTNHTAYASWQFGI